MTQKRIDAAEAILAAVGMPRAQLNERSALSLLALADLTPDKKWARASAPLIGITPIMDWVREQYGKLYAPNTRETFRRQTMHQFVDGGIALYNPDNPERPVNSPKAVYQLTPRCWRSSKPTTRRSGKRLLLCSGRAGSHLLINTREPES